MTLWPLSQEVSVSIGGQARLSLRQEICEGRNRIFCSRSKLSKRFYCRNADLLVLVSKGCDVRGYGRRAAGQQAFSPMSAH